MREVSLENVMRKLENMEARMENMEKDLNEVRRGLPGVKRELAEQIERLERQVELQDLSFRALVKAAKASHEIEEELEGAYVREGTGFNTKRTKWVRDPLA